MLNVISKVSNKALHTQAHEVVLDIHEFVRLKAETMEVLVNLKKNEHVWNTGISKWAVIHINKLFEAVNSGEINSFSKSGKTIVFPHV